MAGAVAGLWGDGFADDGFAATRSVADWDVCSPDEYALLFPGLVPADGRLPAPALVHLGSCVAARAARLARLANPVRRGGGAGAGGTERAWFPEEGDAARVLRGLGILCTPPERVAAERRSLAFLESVLDGVRRGLAPAWSEDGEAWFAFGSGLHPAYLWPESLLSPDRGLTAAWLGHLDRGRAALVPEAAAAYLLDAVLAPVPAPVPGKARGEARGRDRALAAMVGTGEDARRLRSAAAARLAGRDPVVRLGCGRAALRSPWPAAASRKDAFEHA